MRMINNHIEKLRSTKIPLADMVAWFFCGKY